MKDRDGWRRFAVLVGMALGAAAADPRAQRVPPPLAGAISGVVVDAHAGQPLAGVAVTLTGSVLPKAISTLTDSKGRFVFTDLPASDGYSLAAIRSGYQSGPHWSRPLSPGTRLALAQAEWRSDITIEMEPLSSLGGTIVDEHGEAAVDVVVRAMLKQSLGGFWHWVDAGAARTDDRGVYRIASLRVGTYLVHVPSVQAAVPASVPLANLSGLAPEDARRRSILPPRVPSVEVAGLRLLVGQYAVAPHGATTQVYPQLFYPGVRSVRDALPVELRTGEERLGLDLSLAPVPARRVSGRVIGPADVAAGITIRLLPVGSESLGHGSEQATAMADPDGTFVFPAVPAGEYSVQASTTTHWLRMGGGSAGLLPDAPARQALQPAVLVSESFAFVMNRSPGTSPLFGERRVVVGLEDVSDLAVVVRSGARLTGRVVTESGGPLPSPVHVRLTPASGDPQLGWHGWEGRVASDARSVDFSIDGVRPGQYVLSASAGGFVMRTMQSADGGTGRQVEIRPDADGAHVLVTMADRSAAPGATLSGQVRGADGRLAGNAAVILFPVEPARWAGYGISPPIRSQVVIGREGYRFTDLAADDYFVVAVAARDYEAWRDPRFLEAAATVAERVAVSGNVVLTRELTIRRVVVR